MSAVGPSVRRRLNTPRLLLCTALAFGVGVAATPLAVASNDPSGHLEDVTGLYCDLYSGRATASIVNDGQSSIHVGIYGDWSSDRPISSVVDIPGGGAEELNLYPSVADTEVQLWTVRGRGGAYTKLDLLDTVSVPANLDCSHIDPSARVGSVDPKTCKLALYVDNSRSSGPIQVEFQRTSSVIAAGAVETLRARVVWGSDESFPSHHYPLRHHAYLRLTEVRGGGETLADRTVRMKCREAIPTIANVGMQAPLTGLDHTATATFQVPSLADGKCTVEDPSGGTSVRAQLNTLPYYAYVSVRSMCVDGHAVAQVSTATEQGVEQSHSANFGDTIVFTVDSSALMAQDLTAGWTLRTPSDLTSATAVAIYGLAGEQAHTTDIDITDVAIGGVGLASCPDAVLVRSIRTEDSVRWWVTKVESDDSFGLRKRDPHDS